MVKRRRLNRERVVEEAVTKADEARDVSAVTLTSLAEALDVRPPSLYNHIDSLEDLHYGMAVEGARRLREVLQQAALGLVGHEALLAMANAYREFVQAHPGVYPLTIRAPEADQPELAAQAQEILQLLLLVMASIGLQGDEAIHAIRGLRAVLHGFASLELAEGYKMPLDREESFRRLLSAYLDGITSPVENRSTR
jgi:AcrR family transcriptional regulator